MTEPTSLLLTDLYQLRMIEAMYKTNISAFGRKSVFQMFFRKAPYGDKLAMCAGIGTFLEYLENARISGEEAAYLLSLGFDPGLVMMLRETSFAKNIEVCAVDEGRLVGASEPLVRVTAPFWKAQLIETALLNMVNFQTLIASKARRICKAARGKPVFEFGLRRAQGPNGGLLASRAAIIGGCKATSNVQAGMLYSLPVVGTHAHSWVMAHDSEYEAFLNYAKTNPDNCTLLIDTYSVKTGLENAISVARFLESMGHKLKGVRLDSGDLLAWSRYCRTELDKAGYHYVQIVASNDLDETKIEALEVENAPIDAYGVGTALVTGGTQAALGGVYKLVAYQKMDKTWVGVSKHSEEPAKKTLAFQQSLCHVEDKVTGETFAHVIDDLYGPAAQAVRIDGKLVSFPEGSVVYDYIVDAMLDGNILDRFRKSPTAIAYLAKCEEKKYTDKFMGTFVSDALQLKQKGL